MLQRAPGAPAEKDAKSRRAIRFGRFAMIAQLEGVVLDVTEGQLILDVGGVGFQVNVPLRDVHHPGERTRVYIHLHVRENELSLYGFLEPESKTLFELLLGVSGVGPKAALSVLGTFSPDTLKRAIFNGQPEVLSRAPGVGRKTAEAIVLHLKDKIAKLAGPTTAAISEDDADVISALTALGFSLVEAQRALQQLPRDASFTFEEKLRRALALLS